VSEGVLRNGIRRGRKPIHDVAMTAAERQARHRERLRTCTLTNLQLLIDAGRTFGAIHADPPWRFRVYSGKGKMRSAENHYETQALDDIKRWPVAQLAAKDCALFMWCVIPEIPGALEVIRAWGFSYKTTAFTWVKQNRSGHGLFWGMGYWTRANAELCLLATRGQPRRINKDVHQIVMSPVMEHSRKPDETYARIERLVHGPYLDLFGRRPLPGWTVFGNEWHDTLFTRDIAALA
jgi:N6-adenosine-specific RNA methylase IME4